MIKLLKKEFFLAMHPITPMMLFLAAMVLIPNYPYVVVFFYVSMAIFFTCLLGRENNDVVYSLNLPISKENVVKGRFLFAVIIQLVQLLIMIPFSILSQKLNLEGNKAGMSANISLFAIGFIVYGIFNFIFFLSYYKDINKVGIAFVKSSILLFVCVILDVVFCYAVPFVKNFLNTKDPLFLPYKFIFLAIGIILYVILTMLAYRISIRNFNKQDLN